MEEFLEEQEVNLATAIAQYEKIKGATEQPWFCNELSQDEYDYDYMEAGPCMEVGPYDLQGRYGHAECNSYYEECIAMFMGANHNAKANAQLAVASVNLVPRLIARIRELEAKTATGLSEDVAIAIEALNKWKNKV